jgi:hypothetical protein
MLVPVCGLPVDRGYIAVRALRMAVCSELPQEFLEVYADVLYDLRALGFFGGLCRRAL